jgi:hypothetical protein
MPQNILIIGATRGLGASLANAYASQPDTTVFGTTRSAAAPIRLDDKIIWIPYIDVSESSVGAKLVNQLGSLGGGGWWGGMTEGGVTAFDIVVCRPCVLGRSQICFGGKLLRRVTSRRRILRRVRNGMRKLRCTVRLPSLTNPPLPPYLSL